MRIDQALGIGQGSKAEVAQFAALPLWVALALALALTLFLTESYPLAEEPRPTKRQR